MGRINNHYFILTGAMGAGKSTLLQALEALDYRCVEEPARPVIAEQRSLGGDGVFEKDPSLFIELMLARAVSQYQQLQDYQGTVIFDRGIPDMLGYAHLANLELAHAQKAAEDFRYNSLVFFTPGWKEIYRTDDERTMSFEAANQFGIDVKKIYESLGYKVVDVPLGTPQQRAAFIMKAITAISS